MGRSTLLFFTLFLLAPGSAFSDDHEAATLRQGIATLAAELSREAETCDDIEALRSSHEQLRTARQQLHRRHNRRAARQEAACIDFAARAHEENSAPYYALQSARRDCAEPLDLRVARLAFAAYSENSAAYYALQSALRDARREELSGRDMCLRQSYRAYRANSAGYYAWQSAIRDCAARR